MVWTKRGKSKFRCPTLCNIDAICAQRVIATTIATVAQPLGVAVGFVFPSIFVKTADADPGQENVDNARHHIFQSQLWQAVVGTAVLLLLLVFFKEKPKTPPSAAGSGEADDKSD